MKFKLLITALCITAMTLAICSHAHKNFSMMNYACSLSFVIITILLITDHR